jgi:hypothetical protein
MTRQNTNGNFNPLVEALSFDRENGIITAANTDWLVVQGRFFRDLLSGFASLHSADPSSALKKVGENVGREFVAQSARQGYKPKEIPTVLELMLNVGGWGKAQVRIDTKNKSGSFILENRKIAKDAKQRETYVPFIEGFLDGLAEQLLGTCANWVKIAHDPGDPATELLCEFHLSQKLTKKIARFSQQVTHR